MAIFIVDFTGCEKIKYSLNHLPGYVPVKWQFDKVIGVAKITKIDDIVFAEIDCEEVLQLQSEKIYFHIRPFGIATHKNQQEVSDFRLTGLGVVFH